MSLRLVLAYFLLFAARSVSRVVPLALTVVVAFAPTARGQQVVLRGVVTSSQTTLAQARISIAGISTSMVTDSTGEFGALVTPGDVRIIVRKFGYLPYDRVLRIATDTTLRISLARSSTALDTIRVMATATVPPEYSFTTRFDTFFERRATAIGGAFFDKNDLRRHGGLPRALRTLPGVRVRETSGGHFDVVFTRCAGTTGPSLVINGVSRDMSALQTLREEEIELAEVYRGVASVPVEARGNGCGALIVYTQ